MAKIYIDRNKCIGCGACEATCPQTFEIKGGKAKAKRQVVDEITCEKEAQEGCPVGAISIR